jgi:hypothetical protein
MRSSVVRYGLLMVLASISVQAQSRNPYLSQAKVFYQGLEYEKCVQRLEQATRWNSSSTEQSEIELLAGICKFQLGKPHEEITDHFRLALQIDPDVRLPAMVSPKIQSLFQQAGGSTKPKDDSATADAKRSNTTTKTTDTPAAATEVVATPSGPSYLWPNVLVGVGAGAIIAGVILGVTANGLASSANATTDIVEKPQLASSARGRALTADICLGLGVATAAAGIVWRVLTPKNPAATALSVGPTGVSYTWVIDL